MTGRLATTLTDRRKQIRLLQDMRQRLKDRGDDKANSAIAAEARKGYRLHDEAFAIRWALHYVEQHVCLETGELTVSLEPLETAS